MAAPTMSTDDYRSYTRQALPFGSPRLRWRASDPRRQRTDPDVARGRAVGIICLLSDEHLRLYPDGSLVDIYRTAGFEVRHVPVTDHKRPPLSAEELAHVLAAYRELPKPVLVHCSAGIDRTGAAIRRLTASEP
jgi:protein-tyrosine phosphatase